MGSCPDTDIDPNIFHFFFNYRITVIFNFYYLTTADGG